MRRLWSRPLLALLLSAVLAAGASTASADGDSGPTLVVDRPGDGAAVVSPTVLIGWAISPGNGASTGVDAVEVYLDGPMGTGTLLGAATYGLIRPDVALASGDSRYAPSGWTLQTELPPGARTLYVYTHLAEPAGDQGWVGPWRIAVQVDAGPPVAGPVRREPTSAAASGGGSGCLDREPGSGRCTLFSGSNYASCAVPDRETGRCLVRPATANPAALGPAAGAIPGSWTMLSASTASAGLGGAPEGGANALALLAGGPLSSGLGTLIGSGGTAGTGQAWSGPGGGTAGGAQAGSGPSPATGSGIPPSGSGTSSALSGSGSLGAVAGPRGGVARGGTSSALAPTATAGSLDTTASVPTMTLSAAQVGRGQVQLTWNQMGLGAVSYEVRRCPGVNTPIHACTVVATVQGGSYQVLLGDGVYVVRAIGPLGQFQGESNRVQLCCGS